MLRGKRFHLSKGEVSAAGYVRRLIEASADSAVALVYLRKALENIVQGWDATVFEGTVYVSRLLDLIAFHKPEKGRGKVIKFLNQFGQFGAPLDVVQDQDDAHELRKKALRTLYAYVAPPEKQEEDSEAFIAHVGLLEDCLHDPRYSGYAAAQLVEFGRIKGADSTIRCLIADFPASLKELVSHFIKSSNQAAAERHLSQIYAHCLALDFDIQEQRFQNHFNEVLAKSSASLSFDNRVLPVIQHRNRMLRLDVLNMETKAKIAFLRSNLPWLVEQCLGFSEPDRQARCLTNILVHCLKLDEPGQFELTELFKQSILSEKGRLIVKRMFSTLEVKNVSALLDRWELTVQQSDGTEIIST